MDMSEILSELDDHGFADTSSTRKVAVVNDTYWDICGREDWPFLEAVSTSISTVNAQSFITMPANFLRAISLANPSGTFTLLYEDYETMAKLYPTLETTTGTPLYYYFIAGVINLYPVPNAVLSLKLRFTAWPAELAANATESAILIPQRHHRALVTGALSRLYAMEDDPENSAIFSDQYEKRIEHIARDLLKRRIDGTRERRAKTNPTAK